MKAPCKTCDRQTATHHTDAPHTRLWLAAVTVGCVATIFLIIGAIPWACGAWT